MLHEKLGGKLNKKFETIIYVKDLFTLHGVWISEEVLVRKLITSSNWISEFLILKKAVGLSHLKFNTNVAQYVNIKETCILYHGNHISILGKQKANFFYNIHIYAPFL